MPDKAKTRGKKLLDCGEEYARLDRCAGTPAKVFGNNKFMRLPKCKPHWTNFMRCIKVRDKRLLRNVQRWEENHIQGRPLSEREEYIANLESDLRYTVYLSGRWWNEPHEPEYYKWEREKVHLVSRIANLKKSQKE